jgi:hypothetical protein
MSLSLPSPLSFSLCSSLQPAAARSLGSTGVRDHEHPRAQGPGLRRDQASTPGVLA